MSFKKLFILLILSLIYLPSFSQEAEDYEYNSEFIWGINKNTNSGLIGGLVFRYSRNLGADRYHGFGLELINVKHPKEVRYQSYATGNTFIWGKQNYLYSIRAQYDREWVFFKKAPQQGVQISALFAAGPTLGIVAPYYVKVIYGDSRSTYETRNEQYDPQKHQRERIIGTGNLFEGLEKSKINLGFNAKASLSFEFGTFKSNVTGFELGFLAEGFPEKIILMPTAENNSFFTSAFITLYYGSRR